MDAILSAMQTPHSEEANLVSCEASNISSSQEISSHMLVEIVQNYKTCNISQALACPFKKMLVDSGWFLLTLVTYRTSWTVQQSTAAIRLRLLPKPVTWQVNEGFMTCVQTKDNDQGASTYLHKRSKCGQDLCCVMVCTLRLLLFVWPPTKPVDDQTTIWATNLHSIFARDGSWFYCCFLNESVSFIRVSGFLVERFRTNALGRNEFQLFKIISLYIVFRDYIALSFVEQFWIGKPQDPIAIKRMFLSPRWRTYRCW